MLEIYSTPLKDAKIIRPLVFKDERGYFFESFQSEHYQKMGFPRFVQDNTSRSKKGVLRGLHYQQPHAQAKLVWVSHGAVLDVIVDLRLNSPTFKKTYSLILSDENHEQLFVPSGFAHGFYTLSESVDLHYKCSDFYHPQSERGIIWNDPELNIAWPTSHPLLSHKDQLYPSLTQLSHEDYFP